MTNTPVTVRRARTADVPAIKRLVDIYAGKILLEKNLVTLYEAVQEFWVGELDGQVVSCGALHVLWADLGEVRTVAVDPRHKGIGAGHAVVATLIEAARELGLRRVFVLTFEVRFFSRHGFAEIEGTPVTHEVYEEMRRSYDTGVAEFLDLSYVKPNTLGNSRMLLNLSTPYRRDVSMFAVFYTYSPATTAGRDQFRAEHRAWLAGLVASGGCVSAGAYKDGSGALLLFARSLAQDAAALARFLESDPFLREGLVEEVVVREWTPALGALREQP